MQITAYQLDEQKSLSINGMLIENVKDFKIISSADGTTELIIEIKYKADTVKCDLLTN